MNKFKQENKELKLMVERQQCLIADLQVLTAHAHARTDKAKLDAFDFFIGRD